MILRTKQAFKRWKVRNGLNSLLLYEYTSSKRFYPQRLIYTLLYILTYTFIHWWRWLPFKVPTSASAWTLWHEDQGNRTSDLLITRHWLYLTHQQRMPDNSFFTYLLHESTDMFALVFCKDIIYLPIKSILLHQSSLCKQVNLDHQKARDFIFNRLAGLIVYQANHCQSWWNLHVTVLISSDRCWLVEMKRYTVPWYAQKKKRRERDCQTKTKSLNLVKGKQAFKKKMFSWLLTAADLWALLHMPIPWTTIPRLQLSPLNDMHSWYIFFTLCKKKKKE